MLAIKIVFFFQFWDAYFRDVKVRKNVYLINPTARILQGKSKTNHSPFLFNMMKNIPYKIENMLNKTTTENLGLGPVLL